MEQKIADYSYLFLMPVGDALKAVEKVFGVRVRVGVLMSSELSYGDMCVWQVDCPHAIHRNELHNPPVTTLPYLDPSMVPLDDQVLSCLVNWCEQCDHHMKS